MYKCHCSQIQEEAVDKEFIFTIRENLNQKC